MSAYFSKENSSFSYYRFEFRLRDCDLMTSAEVGFTFLRERQLHLEKKAIKVNKAAITRLTDSGLRGGGRGGCGGAIGLGGRRVRAVFLVVALEAVGLSVAELHLADAFARVAARDARIAAALVFCFNSTS